MPDNRANIKVSREFYEEHNNRRQELGVTWEAYIEGNAPDALEGVHEQLDRIELAAEAIEERTGRLERAVDDLGGQR